MEDLIEIPHHIPARIKNKENQLIPKCIYQTWKSRKLPLDMHRAVIKTIELNPDYDYYFFGDEDCRSYLSKNYPEDYLEAFDDLVPGAFKADFWRYAVIYKEGGVYIDVDFDCVKPLDEIIQEDDSLILVKDHGIDCCTAIFQAFIASVPNNGVIKETLELCFSNLQKKIKGKNALDITGPGMMGKAFNKYTYGKICDIKLNTGTFIHNNEKYRILIHSLDDSIITDKDGTTLFRTKFATYDEVRSDNYGDLYRQGQIYRSVPFIPTNTNINNRLVAFGIVLLIILLILMIAVRNKN